MNSESLFFIFLILATFITFTKYAYGWGQRNIEVHPYLALIEVQQQGATKDSRYYNGVLATLVWVLTCSHDLAQEPTGKPANDSFVVYSDMNFFEELDSAPRRKVTKVLTDLIGEGNNTYFPNLVLLKLESAFHKSRTLATVIFNIGMLSYHSFMVGWARDSESGAIISKPEMFPVNILTSKQCSALHVVKIRGQFCSTTKYMKNNSRLLEGALLVDENRYITGIMQFPSYMTPQTSNMSIMVLVHLSYFKTLLRYYVPDVNEVFLTTDLEDDMEIDISNEGEEDNVSVSVDAGLQLFLHWTWILNTLLVVLLFFLYRNQNNY